MQPLSSVMSSALTLTTNPALDPCGDSLAKGVHGRSAIPPIDGGRGPPQQVLVIRCPEGVFIFSSTFPIKVHCGKSGRTLAFRLLPKCGE